MSLASFAAAEQRVNSAVTQHLANATVQRTAGGPAWAASYEVEQPERSPYADVRTPFADVATVALHTLSMWLTGFGGLAEGDDLILTTRHWPAGQTCRVSTPVVPDASGWATFVVVPLTPVAPVTP